MANFEDQDWEELGAQARRGALDTATTWKIATGVIVGMLLGGALVYVLDHGMAQQGLSVAARALQRVGHVAAPAGALAPQPAASGPENHAARQDKRDASAAVPGSPPPSTTASAAGEGGDGEAVSTQRALQRADEAKERAWARYYVKPAQCDVNPGRDTIVECANHFIRARREFEAAYAAGKR